LRRDIESAFTHTENQVAGLRALHEEMFRSISIRFDEKERRLVEAAMAGKTLVEAAFASSKPNFFAFFCLYLVDCTGKGAQCGALCTHV
jgi:hypothetical protein